MVIADNKLAILDEITGEEITSYDVDFCLTDFFSCAITDDYKNIYLVWRDDYNSSSIVKFNLDKNKKVATKNMESSYYIKDIKYDSDNEQLIAAVTDASLDASALGDDNSLKYRVIAFDKDLEDENWTYSTMRGLDKIAIKGDKLIVCEEFKVDEIYLKNGKEYANYMVGQGVTSINNVSDRYIFLTKEGNVVNQLAGSSDVITSTYRKTNEKNLSYFMMIGEYYVWVEETSNVLHIYGNGEISIIDLKKGKLVDSNLNEIAAKKGTTIQGYASIDENYFVITSVEYGFVMSRATGNVVAKVPGLYGYNPDTKELLIENTDISDSTQNKYYASKLYSVEELIEKAKCK